MSTTTLKTSMLPTASFQFKNNNLTESKRLCFFPGHFDVTEIVPGDNSNPPAVAYSNPAALVNAGFACDQVADDYCGGKSSGVSNVRGESGAAGDFAYEVKITPVSKRTRYRDFLNYIRLSNLRVVKMRITDLLESSASNNHAIFNQEMEISASSIGQKAGSDFIQLTTHKKASNYDQTFIEIDLNQQNLLLDETTLMAMDIPAGAHFQIDFTLSK